MAFGSGSGSGSGVDVRSGAVGDGREGGREGGEGRGERELYWRQAGDCKVLRRTRVQRNKETVISPLEHFSCTSRHDMGLSFSKKPRKRKLTR
ncbi:hypothetical protein TIFTF001_019883 [Ficus carica]|uniref:Uncharacterized protein n=1 Tax=Ficus carica TaxID=3494 RepID=A0AA88D9B3_FICCA|nr:hypothetical protein TIFTF001_019883 [Ficus carica]